MLKRGETEEDSYFLHPCLAKTVIRMIGECIVDFFRDIFLMLPWLDLAEMIFLASWHLIR